MALLGEAESLCVQDALRVSSLHFFKQLKTTHKLASSVANPPGTLPARRLPAQPMLEMMAMEAAC